MVKVTSNCDKPSRQIADQYKNLTNEMLKQQYPQYDILQKSITVFLYLIPAF